MTERNTDRSEHLINENIFPFIAKQSVLTFATSLDNIPYCCSCFYATIGTEYLVFKSSGETRHINEALQNNQVAGTINPPTIEINKIQGIQFCGKLINPDNNLLMLAKKEYHTKFPFALITPGELWVIELSYIKMTDNQLGFGKKIIWKNKAYGL